MSRIEKLKTQTGDLFAASKGIVLLYIGISVLFAFGVVVIGINDENIKVDLEYILNSLLTLSIFIFIFAEMLVDWVTEWPQIIKYLATFLVSFGVGSLYREIKIEQKYGPLWQLKVVEPKKDSDVVEATKVLLSGNPSLVRLEEIAESVETSQEADGSKNPWLK